MQRKTTAARHNFPRVFVILAILYPPLKYIWGCVWLFSQARKDKIYFTELAERVEYGIYAGGTVFFTDAGMATARAGWG